MKTFQNSVVDIRAKDFIVAEDYKKREFITDAVWANIQWLLLIADQDFESKTLNDHVYFGACNISKDEKHYTISYSQWGYSDQKQFDSKIVFLIEDHFGLLRSLMYRLSSGENVAGNLFHSYISHFEKLLNTNTEGMSLKRTIEFLDMCQYNRPMFSITLNECGNKYNFHVVR
nr:hypothetical protein [uncultured Acinetobacter sp.]